MKQYAPTSLSSFLNESKSIMLKRKYGQNDSVIVGSNAPLRNQVLSYVSENLRVSKTDLKRFIAGLNEGSKNPIAAANMWLTRNSKFFITENKNGITYFKLSNVGKRLTSGFSKTQTLSEAEEINLRKQLNLNRPGLKRPIDLEHNDIEDEEIHTDLEDGEEDFEEYPLPPHSKVLIPKDEETEFEDDKFEKEESEFDDETPEDLEDDEFSEDDLEDDEDLELPEHFHDEEFDDEIKPKDEDKNYDFVDRRKGFPRPGIYDEMTMESAEGEEKCEHGEDKDECEECNEQLDEASKSRLKRIIENIKSKSKKKNKLNEAEEESTEETEEKPKEETDASDELTFDDLDLSGDEKEEGENLEKQGEEIEDEGKELEHEGEESEGENESKVEITEFVITVDNVEEAIKELEEKGVTAEQVVDEEGEPIEDQIKVSAENWEQLKEWLESKGVDTQEMFGGEIEVEDDLEENPEETPEGEEGTEEGEPKEGEDLENLEDSEPTEKTEEKPEEKPME